MAWSQILYMYFSKREVNEIRPKGRNQLLQRNLNVFLDLFPCPFCRPDSQTLKLGQRKLLLCGDEQEEDQKGVGNTGCGQVFAKEEKVM